MPKLIDTLRVQHQEIRRAAARVSEAADRDDVPAVCAALDALAAGLLAHLAVEDAHLYPALTQAAEQTQLEVPARIARTYEHNMTTISVALKAFLEKYSRAFVMADFRRDWPLVSQLLADRIYSEEATLYPLYTTWIEGS
ncbi:MAG: hemerythrin domain-containing protein [Myxococcota bacterium]|nr:hemerythrin domain-containing protein [Deltaproteobacteria bacterium]MDQ3336143.1 hemerythrin domain-containing protein [Myxococcota bacterium]